MVCIYFTIEADFEKYQNTKVSKYYRTEIEGFGSAGCSCVWILFLIEEDKRVVARGGGLVLGELKIGVISTFIVYVG